MEHTARSISRIGWRTATGGETHPCGSGLPGKPGERFPESRRHEIEKASQFQRHHVAGNVDELDRHRVELEGIQHDLELAGVDGLCNVIVQQLRESETANRGVDRRIGRRNLQPRRNGEDDQPACVRTPKAPVRREHRSVESHARHVRQICGRAGNPSFLEQSGTRAHDRTKCADSRRNQTAVGQSADTNRHVDVRFDQIDIAVRLRQRDIDLGKFVQEVQDLRQHVESPEEHRRGECICLAIRVSFNIMRIL